MHIYIFTYSTLREQKHGNDGSQQLKNVVTTSLACLL